MSIVLASQDIVKGQTGKPKNNGSAFTQPLQFISLEDKTNAWCSTNLDWAEYQGLRQILRKAPHFAKNFNLAQGIIDKSDYIHDENNRNADVLANLGYSETEESNLDLKFYPIIPNFINTMCTEFAKRNTKIMFMSSDEYSYNEMLEMKRSEIEQVLLKEAEDTLVQKLVEAGKDPENPDDQPLFQQASDPNNLKTLPEIQSYFSKNYRSMVEEWASHQYKDDYLRFGMDELEQRNFRNSLITDSEYWHFRMFEDDYRVDIWNPMFTFVFKSPETRYTSQGYGVGNVQLLTIPEAVDNFGSIMTEEQLRSLERIYPQTNAGYAITGYAPESYYDNSKTMNQNVDGPSLGMRQLTSMTGTAGAGYDILTQLMNHNEYGEHRQYLLRATTYYWKSQRKVGHLTKIKENGEVVVTVVDESYKVTDKPLYNTTLIKNKNPQTLIFGEHIDWTWINWGFGGVKLGPNVPSYAAMPASTSVTGLQPMYLGIGQNTIGPIKYQFKGDNNLYGCKLPVEGATFSDYNTRSVCSVDLLKPYQIGFNVVNNQISDILMDEIGTVIAFDQNQLPQESLGESWGKGNYAKAWVAMKNFNILPLDRRLANTEGASGQQALQQLDLSQTQRLLSRIQLATYFKNEGLGLMGITPQRLGQPTGRQTATGVEENLNASYNQTEQYFIQHSDYLMPRVYQMLIDLAQYYQSTKPSVRLQYITSKEERVNFEINGTSLLLRDLNVYSVSTATNRNVVEELRKLLITNNTAGGTIYQLGNLLTADSLGEMNSILKSIETKTDQQKQQEYQQEQQIEKQRSDATLTERKLELEHEEREAELNRRNELLIAQIRAAGYSGSVDLDANGQNDYLDNLKVIQNNQQFQDSIGFEREKENNRLAASQDKALLEKEKLNTQLRSKQMDLEISRENQTKAEIQKRQQQKDRDKKKSTK